MKTKKTMLAGLLAAALAGACPAMAEDAAPGNASAQEAQAQEGAVHSVPLPQDEALDAALKEARKHAEQAARCGLESRAAEARNEADMLALRSEMSKLTARAFLLANVLRQRQGLPEAPADLLETWRQRGESEDADLPGNMDGISDPGVRSELYALWSAFNQVIEATVRR